jgi:hypothetical protein
MPDDCILVPLTRGKFAVIDMEDADRILPFKWCLHAEGYAYRRRRLSDGPGPMAILMHRVVLNAGPGESVDHVDRDRLNNRRANLRKATKGQNAMNHGLRADNTSGFRGVEFHPPSGRWRAYLTVNNRTTFLGSFATADEAVQVRDAAAVTAYGEYAWTHQNAPV